MLDLSGQRQIALTMNDPAVTKLWVPARPGDDAQFSFGGAYETRISLNEAVRIERRLKHRRNPKRVNGEHVRTEGGDLVYESEPYHELVLVTTGSLSGFVRGSLVEQPADPQPGTVYERHISSTVMVKRLGEQLHALETGELVDEWLVGELLAS
jgi:hypothetical protein